jgi:predicted alpha/beta-hydrolase family hydrolase
MNRAVLTVLVLALLAPAVASAQVRVGSLTIQRFEVETGRLVAYGLQDGAEARVPVARITVTCSRARLEFEQASAPLILRGKFCGGRRTSIVAKLNALVR